MAVQRIEEYGDVLKVILKPTEAFPVGYFYTDNNSIARELVKSYTWYLHKRGKTISVITSLGTPKKGQKILYFHQEYAKRVLDYYPNCIDHINRLEIDNRDYNLNIVTSQQNNRNRPTIGYKFVKNKLFLPRYTLNGNHYYFSCSFKTEPEALITTFKLRQEIYADYNYSFLLDRQDDLDILNLELTGKITSDYATYLHVKRYVENNAWYIYRYNLFEYCKQNNIAIPDFSLDSQGFMINPVTKERLCPY